MGNTLKYVVLGSGHGGRAICGQIADKGYSVGMYKIRKEETADYLKLKAKKQILLKGDISAGGKLQRVTTDIKEAVEGVNVVLIVVPSFAHEQIFHKLIPHLKDGQHVIIVPGNYGGLLLKKMMADMGVKKEIIISETVSLPYACRSISPDTVMIYKKKSRLKIASSPSRDNPEVVNIMNDIFGGYVNYIPGENLLEVDLDNLNQTVHPLPVLLNYGDIERNPETFRHYMDGISPLVSEKMMQMDEERLAIGNAFALKLMPVMEQWKMYYGHNESKTYHEFVNSPESPYRDVVGHNVKSRYLTEDVPGLNVPALQLAEKVEVETPVIELTVRLTSWLHSVDYVSEGTTLEKLGVHDKAPEEIVALSS
jgi:opine dehydrogenase